MIDELSWALRSADSVCKNLRAEVESLRGEVEAWRKEVVGTASGATFVTLNNLKLERDLSHPDGCECCISESSMKSIATEALSIIKLLLEVKK
mgnify:CR=1 FL=1